MNKVEYLLEQPARAERLARSILDTGPWRGFRYSPPSAARRRKSWTSAGWRPPDLLVQDAEDGDAGSAPRTSNCDWESSERAPSIWFAKHQASLIVTRNDIAQGDW